MHNPTETIVVGIDGSDSSKEALRWAARQARLTGAALRIVSSWQIPVMAYGAMVPFPADLDFAQESRQVVDDAVAEVLDSDPTVKVETEIVEGAPALELLRAAQDADLLVVGSRGHGAFAGMLLGSVSQHCVSHAHCPVAVIRNKAEAGLTHDAG